MITNLALTLACAAVVACSGPAAPEQAAKPGVVHSPRPLTDVVFERTPERVANGGYLVNGILQCVMCHSERDWSKPGAPPVAGKTLAGAVWWNKPWLVAPNLTPDLETGIGRWTDDMLSRAIREGVAHDGRVLHPQMWSSSFRRLTDEDVASVIVYLRSLTPVRNPLPATVLPKEVAGDLDVPEPLTRPVPAPDRADPLARGRYLAYVADCGGCHTSWYTPRNPGLLAGGNLVERGEDRRAYSTNITSDPSGIAYYDHALFRDVMRTGRVRARDLSPIMPWTAFRHLSDPDLDALFDYLRAYQPAKHSIDNTSPTAACEICGGTHPLGEYNKARPITFIAYNAEDGRDLVGVYRFDDGVEIEILIARGKLVGRMGGNDCVLETEDGRVFQCPGEPERMEFNRDPTGRVTGLTSNRVERAVKGTGRSISR